jgi:5'-3' exonuclease
MYPPYIFIDGSYYCFYRFHSLINWWKNAYPEDLDVLENPFDNKIFVDKFKKTFQENIHKLTKKLNIHKLVKPIIIVGKDCKRENIWRNKLFAEYKKTRISNNNISPFFKLVYDEDLFIKSGATKILEHPNLEADDCIALSIKQLQKNEIVPLDIYVITSDKDYLQLANEEIKIYNLSFKKLTEKNTSSNNNDCDLFCKILMGDISDNISSVFPKCGIKTALKYYNNKDLFESMIKSNSKYNEKYELNKTLIDFNCIPSDLIEEYLLSNNIT